MPSVMRDQVAADQASPLTLPLVLSPGAIAAAAARFAPLDRNNRIWLVLVGVTAPAFGSVLSVALWCAFVWAVVSLAFRRFAFRHDHSIRTITIICGFYASVKLLATFGHNGFSGLWGLAHTFVFFAPLFVGIRLRLTPSRDVLDFFILACGVSVILAAPVAAWQTMWAGQLRAEAFCGNPGVFAVMAVLFGSIGALNIAAAGNRRRLLGAAAYVAMIFCVVASGMRAVWAVVPFVTLVIGWAAARNLPKTVFRRGLAATVAVVAAVLIVASGPISSRVAMLGNDIALIQETGNYDSSTGRRIVMLEAGWQAFLDSPWTGHGMMGRMDAVRAQLDAGERYLVPFTHPHNGYLAALLDAGIIGLLALLVLLATPVAIALRSPRDDGWKMRVAIGAILTLTYAISGVPGIMFEHDLMNSAFIVTLIVLACTIAPERRVSKDGGSAA